MTHPYKGRTEPMTIRNRHTRVATISDTAAVEQENHYTTGQSDARPWGDWTVIDAGPGFVVKRIRVAPGGRLSLQRHQHREENWVVVEGTARVTCADAIFDLLPGQATCIGLGDVHRAENPGKNDMVFIEVQTGALLSEDDIERIEDVYGRTR
jgi:mannose-1-phosphate guanylyltransferase / mannose-6-phosphate isomerase